MYAKGNWDMDKGSITFFDVSDVGFYFRENKDDGSQVKVHHSGTYLEVIGAIGEWVVNRTFAATIPWDPEAHKEREPIYCKDLYTDPKTNDSLFVFWRGHSKLRSSTSGIKADARIGADKSDSVKLNKHDPKKIISGEPMYYWFIPSKNLLATIDFKHSSLSSGDVFSYIKRCIDYRVDMSEKNPTIKKVKTDEGSIKVLKYKVKANDKGLYFKFDAKMRISSHSNIDLNEVAPTITHLVYKDKISTEVQSELSPQFQFFNKITGSAFKEHKASRRVIIKDEVNVTVKELQRLIERYQKEYDPLDDWLDMGFETAESNSPRYFSSFINRPHILLDERLRIGAYFGAEQLYNALSEKRNILLPSVDVEGAENGEIKSVQVSN